MSNEEDKKPVEWECYGALLRVKVDGGYIYESLHESSIAICFVPDIDLNRYQSHLRDAYNKGYKDGHEDAKRV